ETGWHLRWKAAYLTFPGWDIEVPVVVAGRSFRADAMNPGTGRVREFVHSLSDAYVAKHLALKAAGLDVVWRFDGEAFVRARRRAAVGPGGRVQAPTQARGSVATRSGRGPRPPRRPAVAALAVGRLVPGRGRHHRRPSCPVRAGGRNRPRVTTGRDASLAERCH